MNVIPDWAASLVLFFRMYTLVRLAGMWRHKESNAAGRQQLRSVADRTHFRAYSGQQMITHGAAPEAGAIGFCFAGTGVVLLDNIQAQTITH